MAGGIGDVDRESDWDAGELCFCENLSEQRRTDAPPSVFRHEADVDDTNLALSPVDDQTADTAAAAHDEGMLGVRKGAAVVAVLQVELHANERVAFAR